MHVDCKDRRSKRPSRHLQKFTKLKVKLEKLQKTFMFSDLEFLCWSHDRKRIITAQRFIKRNEILYYTTHVIK